MAPRKDIRVLISGIHECYLIWKGVFADVIKLRIFFFLHALRLAGS